MKSPWRTKRAFHRRQHSARREQAHFLCDAKAAAKLSRSAGILSEFTVADENRRASLSRFHRRVMRIAVIDAKRRVLAVGITERAPTTTGEHRWEMRGAPGFRIDAKHPRRGEIGVVTLEPSAYGSRVIESLDPLSPGSSLAPARQAESSGRSAWPFSD